MLSNSAVTALLDIRANILLAKSFAAGLTLSDFIHSRKDFYATTRALEIISEAARRLDPEFRGAHADLPWKQITGIGNVLRHNYEAVAENRVWATVEEYRDPLLAAVSAAIDRKDV